MAGILTDRDRLANARAENSVLQAQLDTERERLNHLIDTACLLPEGAQFDMKPTEIRLVVNEGAVFLDGRYVEETGELRDWPADVEAIRTLVKDRADSELAFLAESRKRLRKEDSDV